jgi:hypothetical protein
LPFKSFSKKLITGSEKCREKCSQKQAHSSINHSDNLSEFLMRFLMNEKTSKQKVEVSREERARMTKLTEEVTSRVQEMARIVRGNLGMDVSVPVGKFTMTTGTPENPGRTHLVFEPIIVTGDGGCYADPPGICCECPCP